MDEWIDVQSVISLAGFVFLIYQIWQIQKSLRSSSLAVLNQQLHEIREIFVQYPELRPYFFEGATTGPGEAAYPRVVTVAEMYLNHLEHFSVNHRIFRRADAGAWRRYVEEMLGSSPIMREILHTKRRLYSPDLLKLVETVGSRE